MPDDPRPASDDAGADRLAVGFARLLRERGLDVPPTSTLLYAQALAAVNAQRAVDLYWAGRATLVRRPEDAATYDRAFEEFWRGRLRLEDLLSVAPPPLEITLAIDDPDAAPSDDDGVETPTGEIVSVRWSAAEVLRNRDFAAYSPAEFAEARRLMADLRLVGATRRSRRHRPSNRRRGRPDLRRTVRGALRTGGDPVVRRHLAPTTTPRRIVLLLDVSGSMEPYARALIRFLHAAVVGRGRVEAFALGTRLTRVTRELSSRDPDAALAAAAASVCDWSGGTRLGDSLRRFNDEWGVRGMARGAVVVILSDGWDRGAPEVLAEQMARLSRVAYRVVWVNPLKVTPGYAPLAQGMAAALPFVHEFVEGHSLASLEHLAEVIAR